ncbi:MAG: DUF1178 family protein [Desulfobacterales bacterium]|nr:DUF1178 family protein [Desulfobacterales bacterium]
MIVFDLACDCGCTFEGWFHDRQDFENQQSASFLVCPECGSRGIRKILSPIRTQSARSEGYDSSHEKTEQSIPLASVADALKTLQKFVEENFEDVGTDLATESLKIHYGVAESRNLRGVTTEIEEKKLKEEGINLFKIQLPVKNKDAN